MKVTNIRRIFLIAGAFSLFMSYVGLWIRLINDPVERTGSDFIAFYSAGRIAQTDGAARVYNPLLQQQIQQEEVGFPLVEGQVLLYNHLPFMIPILQVIVSPNYVASFYRWIFLMIALYITGVTILGHSLKWAGVDRNTTLLTALGALLFLPVFFSLMNGQDTAVLFLGTAIWMYGLLSGQEVFSGLGLSLTTVRPQIALFLAIPMLFRYRKVFGGFLLGAGVLALLSVLILGLEGTREFINILLLSTGGEWYGMKENVMFNFIGLLTRTMPQLEANIIRISGWVLYAIALMSSCVLWSRAQNSQDSPIGLTMTLALFVAPHLHFHDLALLLIPIYELIRTSREIGSFRTSIMVVTPIAISLLLLISNISPSLQYTIPYLIMLAIAVYPYYAGSKSPITRPHQSQLPEK